MCSTGPHVERRPSPELTYVPGRQAPCQAPQRRPHGGKCPSPELSSSHLSGYPPKKRTTPEVPQQSRRRQRCPLPGSPMGPNGERHPFIKIQFSHRVPVRKPLHIPQQDPYGERSFISRANGHYSLSSNGVPEKEPSYIMGENIRSPPTEP
jgi:hypothetical protein